MDERRGAQHPAPPDLHLRTVERGAENVHGPEKVEARFGHGLAREGKGPQPVDAAPFILGRLVGAGRRRDFAQQRRRGLRDVADFRRAAAFPHLGRQAFDDPGAAGVDTADSRQIDDDLVGVLVGFEVSQRRVDRRDRAGQPVAGRGDFRHRSFAGHLEDGGPYLVDGCIGLGVHDHGRELKAFHGNTEP